MPAISKLSICAAAALMVLAINTASLQASENADNERLPEEVTVIGQKQFRTLEFQINAAEDLMYGLFNEINTDDRYDIHCTWERPLGTKIKQKVCRPQFLNDATTDAAKDFLSQSTGYGSTGSNNVMSEANRHYSVLEEKMREAISNNQALLEAVARHHQLREEFSQKKTAYFNKKAK